VFYLAATTEPTNNDEFIRALEGGIREVLVFPRDAKIIHLQGNYPAFDLLKIDLTGGRIDTSRPLPPRPVGVGPPKPAVTAKSLQIVANPVQLGAGRVKVDMSARGVTLQYDVDSTGRRLLLPASLSEGRVMMEISRADLEAIILAGAIAAAEKQGAKVTRLELHLTPRGERSLAIDVRVTAKKMMMSGVVRVAGDVDLDDNLVARLSHLTCEGEGVAGKIAASVLAPKIRQAEGRALPLADFAFAGMRPRDVRIESVDPVRIIATFGS
jgi:hypothetical protein